MFPVRKYLILSRQVSPAGVHQVDTGQVVLFGNRLGAKVFLYRKRVVAAPFNGGIVGNNDALLAADPAYAGNNPGCRNLFAVDLVCGQGTEFKKGGAGIQ